MSGEKHTQGRLVLSSQDDYPTGCAEFENQQGGIDIIVLYHDNAKEDARRLVACWNACEGTPTVWLEGWAESPSTATFEQIIGNLLSHRDELLTALERVLATHSAECAAELSLNTATENYTDHHPELDAYTEAAAAASKAEADARDLIAKVNGGTP